MNHTSNAGLFLLQMVFSLLILMALLRFMFQLMRVDYYNPISQMVTRFTDPV
ncbi:MAG: YggT family protein, partial [Gammaproteobacteria bacterium]|nr:YggT family protein [Gammaproteobacteria bacterium]MBT7022424.1 YggT family protein [Gammaproteobacteria bacterium]